MDSEPIGDVEVPGENREATEGERKVEDEGKRGRFCSRLAIFRSLVGLPGPFSSSFFLFYGENREGGDGRRVWGGD